MLGFVSQPWQASFPNPAPGQPTRYYQSKPTASMDTSAPSRVLAGLHLVCTLERLTFFWTSHNKDFSKTELWLRWGKGDAQKFLKKGIMKYEKRICIWNTQVKNLCFAQHRSEASILVCSTCCGGRIIHPISILHLWMYRRAPQTPPQANSHPVNAPNLSYRLWSGSTGTWIAIFQCPLRTYAQGKKTVLG